MKKGICYGVLAGETAREKFALAAAAGFDCVEVNTLNTAEAREECKRAAAETGIEVPSVMNSSHWKFPLSDPDPVVREKAAQGIVESLDTAVALGADTVLVVPAVVTPEVTYEQAWERSVETLKTVLPVAEAKGVALAVENVWNKFLLSPIEFAAYVDSFEHELLKAYFDVGNIVAYGFPQHWIRTLGKRLRKIHIKGFHAKQHAFVQLLEGTIDWQAVMQAFVEVGYDDVITAELSPQGDDPAAGIKKIRQDMDTIFATVGC